jgi:hypothetical protein
MTFDPIVILATITVILSLSGLYLFVLLRKSEQTRLRDRQDLEALMDIVNGSLDLSAKISAESHQNALDICRIGDMASDTCAEVTAHARVLDNHTDRLSALEGEQ